MKIVGDFSFLVTNGRCFRFKEKQSFCNDFRKVHSSSSSSSTSSEPLSPKAPFVVKRRYTFQTLLYVLNSEKLYLLLFSPTYIFPIFLQHLRRSTDFRLLTTDSWSKGKCSFCACVLLMILPLLIATSTTSEILMFRKC